MKKQAKRKLTVRTTFNYEPLETDYEKVNPVSMTVPDEQLTLREIVEKFSREYPKHLLRQGYYDLTDDHEDFDDVDITRQPDFDYVDAMELQETIQSKKNQKEQKTITSPAIIEEPKIEPQNETIAEIKATINEP